MFARMLFIVVACTGAAISERILANPWPGLALGCLFGSCIIWADDGH